MRGKILFVVGLGVGYVFGTRAGRARYNQMKNAALKVWNDPRVQEQVNAATEFVKENAPEVASAVQEQLTARGQLVSFLLPTLPAASSSASAVRLLASPGWQTAPNLIVVVPSAGMPPGVWDTHAALISGLGPGSLLPYLPALTGPGAPGQASKTLEGREASRITHPITSSSTKAASNSSGSGAS